MKNKTVVVGLSGGVDSSVTAYLLKKQGYNVIGVTMQVWQKDIPESGETGIAEVEDARKVAAYLGIPHYVLNFNEEFHKNVIEYFVKTYNDGKTPNPCVVCNRYVKWQALREKAGNLGADYIATGHYAKIEKLENGRYAIKNSKTAKKDQTYALHLLTQEQLEHTIMPLGSYEKDEVRKIAERVGIPVAHKKDSQDMCFIPDGKYANFIYKETGKRAIPGDIVTMDGEVVGKHKGIIFYTVGQRKGLKLQNKNMYVCEINANKNQIVVCDNESLFKKIVVAHNVNMMAKESISGKQRAFAKIRYNHEGADCTVWMEDEKLYCEFDKPQRAVTPGQSLVVYQDGYVLCGGEISSELNMLESIAPTLMFTDCSVLRIPIILPNIHNK